MVGALCTRQAVYCFECCGQLLIRLFYCDLEVSFLHVKSKVAYGKLFQILQWRQPCVLGKSLYSVCHDKRWLFCDEIVFKEVSKKLVLDVRRLFNTRVPVKLLKISIF